MPKSSPQKNGLHSIGYQVIPRAIEIDERVLTSIQNICTKKIGSIFNHNEINSRNDHKRRQRNLPLKTKYMLNFDENVREIVRNHVNTALIPTDPVILHSRPGCQPQAAHCDYIPDQALKTVSDDKMPLAALICLMPNTRLQVWPNSSRLATSNLAQLKKLKPIACKEVELNPGDIIIFRGDFIHAGSGYQMDNYRIHYYLDSPMIPRIANRTWLIDKSGNDALCRIIQPGKALAVPEEKVNAKKLALSDASFFSASHRITRKRKLDELAEVTKTPPHVTTAPTPNA